MLHFSSQAQLYLKNYEAMLNLTEFFALFDQKDNENYQCSTQDGGNCNPYWHFGTRGPPLRLTLSVPAYLANLSVPGGVILTQAWFSATAQFLVMVSPQNFFYRQPLMFTRGLQDIKLISQILFSL